MHRMEAGRIIKQLAEINIPKFHSVKVFHPKSNPIDAIRMK